MQEVFNFIISHYEAILSVLTLIISVVVFIIRKKPVSDVQSIIYAGCIQAIKLAEAGDKKGKDKLDAAVMYVAQYLNDYYPSLDTGKYLNYIAGVIEVILSTPQKKED